MLDIIKQFTDDLTETQEELLELYHSITRRVTEAGKGVDRVSKLIIERQSRYQKALHEAQLKVNTALFGDRKFMRETYTYSIPLELFEGGTVTDGVLTPKTLNTSTTKKPVSYFTGRRDTDFKVLDGIVYLERNMSFPYQELEFKAEGMFYLKLDRYEMVSVLDRYGREVKDSHITNTIAVPANGAVIIRFENNVAKQFKILECYSTELLYGDSATLETPPINIRQYLSEIALNTCDSYSQTDMRWYISINDRPYREIRPLNKHKRLELKSILSTDDSDDVLHLDRVLHTDIGKVFILDEERSFKIQRAFKRLLDAPQSSPVTLNLKSDVMVHLEPGSALRANGELLEGSVRLPKGLVTLEVDKALWNQRWYKSSIDRVLEDKVILKDGSSFDRPKSLFLDLFEHDMYLEEFTPEQLNVRGETHIKADSPEAYLFIKHSTRFVETIKLKVEMGKSQDIPPHITSVTIRGV